MEEIVLDLNDTIIKYYLSDEDFIRFVPVYFLYVQYDSTQHLLKMKEWFD